jgi:hypothetical protein
VVVGSQSIRDLKCHQLAEESLPGSPGTEAATPKRAALKLSSAGKSTACRSSLMVATLRIEPQESRTVFSTVAIGSRKSELEGIASAATLQTADIEIPSMLCCAQQRPPVAYCPFMIFLSMEVIWRLEKYFRRYCVCALVSVSYTRNQPQR